MPSFDKQRKFYKLDKKNKELTHQDLVKYTQCAPREGRKAGDFRSPAAPVAAIISIAYYIFRHPIIVNIITCLFRLIKKDAQGWDLGAIKPGGMFFQSSCSLL